MLVWRGDYHGVSSVIARAATVFLVLAAMCCGAFAEESSAAKPAPGTEPVVVANPVLPEAPAPHHFWDKTNGLLFTGVAAMNATDFVETRDNLRSGGKELNPITRLFAGSTAGLAVNFAGSTAATMGISYLFHKTGHHRLERATAAVAMGMSTQAVIYSGSHRK